MQYLVTEIYRETSMASGEAKIFSTLQAATQYLQEINRNKKLFLEDQELTVAVLRDLLKEKLAIVSLYAEAEEKYRWIITAF